MTGWVGISQDRAVVAFRACLLGSGELTNMVECGLVYLPSEDWFCTHCIIIIQIISIIIRGNNRNTIGVESLD